MASTVARAGSTPGTARSVTAAFRRALGLGLAACLGGGLGPAAAQERVEVVASRAGFKPRQLNVRKGETVRLVLKTADDEHCFAVDALRIEKRIAPGKTTNVDLTADRAGSFPFYCCLEPANEAQRGKLVVSE